MTVTPKTIHNTLYYIFVLAGCASGFILFSNITDTLSGRMVNFLGTKLTPDYGLIAILFHGIMIYLFYKMAMKEKTLSKSSEPFRWR